MLYKMVARHIQAGASFSWQLMLNPAPNYYEAIALAHGYARVRASKTAFEVEVSITSMGVHQAIGERDRFTACAAVTHCYSANHGRF